MARFISLKNAKREYLDTLTGETVSKRQRDKALRSVFSEKPISNERAARLNRESNLELALSRPARGRASILKKEETEKQLILEARKEDLKRKAEIAAELKAQKAIERQIAKQERKKVTRQRVHKGMLNPGSYGARATFNTYNEYLVSLKEAKQVKEIFSYGLGMVGFDEKSGESRAITVFTMQYITNPPIPEARFEERMLEERMERQYFVFQYYFMHLAFKKEYAERLYKEWKASGKPSRAKKKRKGKRK